MTARASFLAILLLLVAGPALVAGPTPAHAMQPSEFAQPAAHGNSDEVRRLAGIVCAEACGQPWAARVAIAQIVAREASSRGMTVVALSERTWFISVYRYARSHPDSWHARQFADPPAWALELADDVLAGRLVDATEGAGHFDGVEHPGDLFVVGQIHFRY